MEKGTKLVRYIFKEFFCSYNFSKVPYDYLLIMKATRLSFRSVSCQHDSYMSVNTKKIGNLKKLV